MVMGVKQYNSMISYLRVILTLTIGLAGLSLIGFAINELSVVMEKSERKYKLFIGH